MREILRKIGLAEEEITLYTTLLRLKEAKPTTLSIELGLARSTVYRFLDSLHQKGLVSEFLQNGIKYYSATSPERLPQILEDRIDEIKTIIPELLTYAVQEKTRKTKVELFKGIEGLKTVMNDNLALKEDYCILGHADAWFTLADIFTMQWMKKAQALKLKGRILISPSNKKFSIAPNEEFRFLPEELITNITIQIYGAKMAQFIFSEPVYTVLIESKDVARNNLAMFDYLWKTARIPNEKEQHKFMMKA